MRTLAVAAFLAALFAALSVAFYLRFTRDNTGASDFYVPWRATQALLLERHDPYSDEFTRSIQMDIFGRLLPPDEDPFPFSYPLYVTLLIAPFIGLPYDAAEAAWLALLLILVLVTWPLLLRNLNTQLRPAPLALLTLWVALFYPTARSLMLGQLSIVVLACLVGSWSALRAKRDGLAGFLLALAMIKPQMFALLLPIVLWWAFDRRRSKFLLVFGATLATLLAYAFVLQPTWPLGFLLNASSYPQYLNSYSPVQLVLSTGIWSTLASLAFVLVLAVAAVRVAHVDWQGLLPLAMWAIIITQIVMIHTASSNQVVLLLPIFYGLRQKPARAKAVFLLAAFLLAPWLVYFATSRIPFENVYTILPLSLGVGVWQLGEWVDSRWRNAAWHARLP